MPERLLSTSPVDYAALEKLARRVAVCTQCALSAGRTHSVFSDGNPESRVMLIGEGPGQNEDETGLPFVGRAGQLLTRILASVGIDRKNDIYICNVVKCRPPQNRKPVTSEMDACYPYLEGQIQAIQPQIILLTGATAVQDLLKTRQGITKIRGQWFDTPYGAKAMPLFHPSYLLRNPSKQPGSPKWLMCQDIRVVKEEMERLGLSVSGQPFSLLEE